MINRTSDLGVHGSINKSSGGRIIGFGNVDDNNGRGGLDVLDDGGTSVGSRSAESSLEERRKRMGQ